MYAMAWCSSGGGIQGWVTQCFCPSKLTIQKVLLYNSGEGKRCNWYYKQNIKLNRKSQGCLHEGELPPCFQWGWCGGTKKCLFIVVSIQMRLEGWKELLESPDGRGWGKHNIERKPCRQRYLGGNKYPRSIWEKVFSLVLLSLGYEVGGSW